MRPEVTRKIDLVVRSLQALAASSGRVKGPEFAAIVGSTLGFAPR